MRQTRFTPGPLRALRVNNTERPWAVVTPNGPFGDEITAGHLDEFDAHLYAAAPELYHVVLDALFALDGVADGDFAPNGETVRNAIAKATAVLRKARGKEPS